MTITDALVRIAGALVFSALALVPGEARAQWYDPAPLMASLRPATRAGLPGSAGLARMDALPLYDLDLEVNPEGHAFRVREELYFTNNERAPLEDVALRLYANTSRRASNGSVILPPLRVMTAGCRDEAGRSLACAVDTSAPSVVSVRPSQPIAPGGRIRLWFELEGRLDAIDASRTNFMAQGMESLSHITAPSDPSTASASDYGLLAVGDGIACLAQWYPVLAPRRGDRWVREDRGTLGDLGSDELSHVRARVSFPDGYRTVTTGVVTAESVRAETVVGLDGGVGIQRNPRRTQQIVAAMVRDFTVVSSRAWVALERAVGDVVVRSHVLPAERAAGERVLDAAAGSLAVYERRFGPYPYADLDVCEAAVVGGAGGVEFAGLVTVASMFYRPAGRGDDAVSQLLAQAGGGNLEASRETMLEFVTAHEVAHQYWHGLVGSDSRDHPFVDEALAQYSAIVYLEDRYGRERARRDGDANVKNNYHLLRALGQQDQPVNRPVSSFATPLSYAGIVYGKAPYFYQAAREALGDAGFFSALQGYVRDNAFRVAAPDAILEALGRGGAPAPQAVTGGRAGRASAPHAGRVRVLARRWLEETHGDQDLGRVSLGTLAARMMGETDPARIREMERMFATLERTGILRGLLGGGGGQGGGLGALLGGGGGQGGGLEALLGGGRGGSGGSGGGGEQGGGIGDLSGILNRGAGGSGGGEEALVRALLQALGGAGGGGELEGLLGGQGVPRGIPGAGGAGGAGGGAAGPGRPGRGVNAPATGEAAELQEILRQFMGD
jgi:hypothetical protein